LFIVVNVLLLSRMGGYTRVYNTGSGPVMADPEVPVDIPSVKEEEKPKEEVQQPAQLPPSLPTLTRPPKQQASPPPPPAAAKIPERDQKLMAQYYLGYGTSARPALKDGPSVRIADLPHEFVPGKGKSSRLIVVGDVHGQLTALKSLLAKINFDNKNGDHLILTGDMVNKGPDSVGVVQYAMDLNASAVRGNHEDRILLSHKEGKRNSNGKEGWLQTVLKNMDLMQADKTKALAGMSPAEQQTLARPGTETELIVASKFNDEQFAWLDSLPVILRMGPFTSAKSAPWNAGTVAVVHAGLVPGLALEKQDPQTVMTMRSLAVPGEMVRHDAVKKQLQAESKAEKERQEKKHPGQKIEQAKVEEKHIVAELERLSKLGLDRMADRRVLFPLENRDGQPWSEVWSRHQSQAKFEEDRTVVIYGHDAKSGLRVGSEVEPEKFPAGLRAPSTTPKANRYAFGLDSGCVYGNQLSALILEYDAASDDIKHSIVMEKCDKAAEAPRD
jgi:hypothetical protein